ncbi:MAG TPA: DUF3108 domain-containing protein [Steroidobacteraceae bacterium]|nr:DUF3108 domain-containing protein [Steroidobacteraceae bacterium]
MSTADRARRRRTVALSALAAWSLALIAATAGAGGLRAHEIVYRTSFKGISAGDLQLTLEPDTAPDSWLYETRAYPGLLASFVVSADSRERSSFTVTPTGVQPQRYSLDDGTTSKHDNVELTYDWTRGRVAGLVRGSALDLAIEPGTQDVMSIRAAPQVDLLAGREPAEYPMLDGREIKHFVYTRAGTERLKTALGEVDTVIYTSDRKGGDGRGRTWRYWYAPSLGFLPVRIEQREDGKARLLFTVRSLKWRQPAPTQATAPAR